MKVELEKNEKHHFKKDTFKLFLINNFLKPYGTFKKS